MTLFKTNAIHRTRQGIVLDIGSDQTCATALGSEQVILAHSLEHEVLLHETRGEIAGPLAFRHSDGTQESCSDGTKIPPFPSGEALEISCSNATRLLVVQSGEIYRSILSSKRLPNDYILLCSYGVPRLSARWLARRIVNELGVEGFFLCDLSTWGYFSFSCFVRGSVLPIGSFAHLRCPLRFVGLRVDAPVVRGQWKPYWRQRVDAMLEYDCFKTPSWQAELHGFLTRGSRLYLEDLMRMVGGSEFVRQYVLNEAAYANALGPAE